MSLPINNSCNHVNHLFNNPLCSSLSLLKRISNVMFHILTLGVPLICYHIVSYCLSSKHLAYLNRDINFDHLNHAKVLLSPLIKDALEFADGELASESYQEVLKQNSDIDGSDDVPRKIIHLSTIHGIKQGLLKDRIQITSDRTDPWDDIEVQRLAGQVLKLGVAIGVLSLYDAKRFANNRNKLLIDIINDPDCYVSKSLYYGAIDYHRFKGGIKWDNINENFDIDKGVNKNRLDRFYEPVTLGHGVSRENPECQWRLLYNEYGLCILDSISRSKISKMEDMEILQRWTKQDSVETREDYKYPQGDAPWWEFE